MTLPATDYNDFVKNPGAADESQIVTRGFRMYVRPYLNGVINTAGEFLSLGATKGYEPSNDETFREFKANLYGTEQTLKRQLASRTRTFNFFTGSTSSLDIIPLFYGSAAKTGAAANAAIKAVEDTGKATTCDAVVVFEPDAGTGLIAYYPSVSLRGTGKGEEDGFETFEFEATIQAANDFVAPDALVDMNGQKTPEGLVYLVPKAEIDRFLYDLFDAVTTA